MGLVSIRHRTVYRYRQPVAFGEHRMMLRPLESVDQRLVSAELHIDPIPVTMHHLHDISGAIASIARFSGRWRELTFDSRVRLDHNPGPAFVNLDDASDRLTGAMPFHYDLDHRADLAPFVARDHEDATGEVCAWARRFVRPVGHTGLRSVLTQMTEAIYEDFRYGTRLVGQPQSPRETLERGGGSCRDFAVLMMDAARSLGLASRFVSGYVCTAPRERGGRVRLGGGHTHAWLQVYLPANGWVEFDPTNGAVGSADLIRVAAVRAPRQALPLHGSYFGASGESMGMEVTVDVEREQIGEGERGIAAPPQPFAPLRFAAGG